MSDIKENLEEFAEDLTEDLEEMVEDLKQERDKLRVQLHLGKMEASDEWQELERKWPTLQAKMKELRDAAAESSDDVGAAARLLAEEIKLGFKKVAKKL